MADLELNSIGNGDGNNYLLRDNSKIPLSGSNQISGSLIPSTDNSIDIGSSTKNIKMLYTKGITIDGAQFSPSDYVPKAGGAVLNATLLGRVDTGNIIRICGGTDNTTGASIQLNGKDTAGNKGMMFLVGYDGTSRNTLTIKPDGNIIADNGVVTKNLAMQEDTVPRSGGAVITGSELAITINNGAFNIRGGIDSSGAVRLYGKDYASYGLDGCVRFTPQNASDGRNMILKPDGTWTWNGTACQITSDQRLKQQIAEIDDKLLDAWKDVNLVQFKYNDAVDQKGKGNARLHTGYVVQQIDSACKEHGVDVSQYGLYCHEEYPEETEEVEVEQEDGTKTKETKVIREASEHYSLRYTEALIVECAYLRKKNKDLQEQLNALSERLEKLENR